MWLYLRSHASVAPLMGAIALPDERRGVKEGMVMLIQRGVLVAGRTAEQNPLLLIASFKSELTVMLIPCREIQTHHLCSMVSHKYSHGQKN